MRTSRRQFIHSAAAGGLPWEHASTSGDVVAIADVDSQILDKAKAEFGGEASTFEGF